MLALAVLTILAATTAQPPRPRPGDRRVDRRRDPPTPQRLRPRPATTESAHPALVHLATNTPSPSPATPLPAQTRPL